MTESELTAKIESGQAKHLEPAAPTPSDPTAAIAKIEAWLRDYEPLLERLRHGLAGGAGSGVTPISLGGTGETSKTPAFDALAPTTTKGDIITSDGNDNKRLAAGANGQVLTADSSEPTGLEWKDPAGAPAVAAKVYNDNPFTLTTGGTAYPISFNHVLLDTGSFYDGGSPTKFTIPTDGIYFISGQVYFDAPAGGNSYRRVWITNNGTDIANRYDGAIEDEYRTVAVSTIAQLTAGDEIVLNARAEESGVFTNSGQENTFFNIFRIAT